MPNLKLEQFHLEQFITLLNDKSITIEVQFPPEPDFKILYGNKIVGIEHTQLIKLPDSRGINQMAHTMIANKIVSKSHDYFMAKSDFCLAVSVDFRCDYGLAVENPVQLFNKDINPLSSFIANFVLERLQLIHTSAHGSYFIFETFDCSTGKALLPDKIHHIAIRNTKNFKMPLWSVSDGGMVPSFFDCKELPITINKKNSKTKNYSNKYDEIWLLIVEDSMDLTTYFHFDDPTALIFPSTFNRILVLRRAENVIIEIKTCLS